MDKNEVLKILSEIKYPGFSRDIVSFGMVKDVKLAGKNIVVSLNISSEQEDKVNTVKQAVGTRLRASGKFDEIMVKVMEKPAQAQTASQADKDPWANRSELTNVKHVVAVASGKGGVGKSTVAANLALALQAQGQRVGLLDLDIYGPSLPIILGINERPDVSTEKKLIPLEKFGLRIMSFGFVSGSNAPAIWRGPMVAKMTEQFFNDVDWGDLDYLVLDLPPGTGDVQLTLVQKLKISGAIMVTTPQDIAVADVSKGADMFTKVEVPVLGVVENMSGLQLNGSVLNRDGETITAALELDGFGRVQTDDQGRFDLRYDLFKRGGGESESRRLGVPLLAEIPLSQALMQATDSGQPLLVSDPEAPVSRLYQSLAQQLQTKLEG